MASVVLQQGKSVVAHVRWSKKPDGETSWESGDTDLAEIEIHKDDSTRATITADGAEFGEVGIYATASFGDKKSTAILDLNVIDGELEDGTIELER